MKTNNKPTYPWFFIDFSLPWLISFFVGLGTIALAIALYFLYTRLSNDLSPDSIAGYLYAIVGTTFLLLTTFCYSIYKRSRKRWTGKLNGALHWHICFSCIALVLLFLHSFGNFNLRSGTYALYAMVALVISGLLGRTLDRILPRLITKEVRKALTEQGEDRLETITQTLQSIMLHNTQEIHGIKPESTYAEPVQVSTTKSPQQDTPVLPSSWDLAYISLAETPQEVERDAAQYRFVPDRKSALAEPGGLLPGIQDHIAELHSVQRALHREQYYRYIIRFWRFFHIILTLLTIGLTLWHLEYAAQLLIPTLLRH